MYFQYDTSGTPLGFIYNGTQYFYMTNQMGDVISITDNQGNELVQYEYDEWGKCNSISLTHEEDGIVANANPIRYRGYYLDSETGYYYLQSRYYDPSICRFINSDIAEISQMSKDIPVGTNLFAYCSNDPINNSDINGFSSYKFVAVGFQFELSACFLGFSGEIGIELIYVISKNTVYAYFYYAGGSGNGYTNRAINYLYSSFKDIVSSPKVSLKNIANLYKYNWSITLGIFAVFTSGNYIWPNNYCTGTTKSSSLSVGKYKGYYSTSSGCKCYGVCMSIAGNSGFSFGTSSCKYKLIVVKKIINQAKSYFSKNYKTIKKAVGK